MTWGSNCQRVYTSSGEALRRSSCRGAICRRAGLPIQPPLGCALRGLHANEATRSRILDRRAAVRSRWALCRAGPWKKRYTDRDICRILGWAASRAADEDAECWPRRRLPDRSRLVDQLEEGDVRWLATL